MAQTLKNCSGAKYIEFLNLMKAYADSISIMVQDSERLEKSAKVILEKFKALRGYQERSVSEWPGTISANRVSLYQADFNDDTIKVLADVRSLEGWLEPEYPEDLTFYHSGKPVFISTTHEGDFYFAENFDVSSELLSKLNELGLKYE